MLVSLLLIGATPFLMFSVAVGSMLSEADGVPQWPIAVEMLGGPWIIVAVLWLLFIRFRPQAFK
jgi:hypothetical protein